MTRALLLGAAILVAGLAVASADPAPTPAEPAAIHALPWRRVALGVEPAPARGEPAVLLYVSASCPHCAGVSTYTDSVTRAQGRRLLVVSSDAESTMTRWRAHTGVRAPWARDSARALARALDVRFVPTVIAWAADGRALTATGADRVAVRRALEGTR